MTQEISRISSENTSIDQQKNKFDKMGVLLYENGSIISNSVKSLQEASTRQSRSFEGMLLLYEDIDENDKSELTSLRRTLTETNEQMRPFLDAIRTARESTQNAPRATQKFNQGKKKLVAALGDLIDVTEQISKKYDEYVTYIDSVTV